MSSGRQSCPKFALIKPGTSFTTSFETCSTIFHKKIQNSFAVDVIFLSVSVRLHCQIWNNSQNVIGRITRRMETPTVVGYMFLF